MAATFLPHGCLSFLSLCALAHMRAMHASRVPSTHASVPCTVDRRRAKLRALCGCRQKILQKERSPEMRLAGDAPQARSALRGARCHATSAHVVCRRCRKPASLENVAARFASFVPCRRGAKLFCKCRPEIGIFFRCACVSHYLKINSLRQISAARAGWVAPLGAENFHRGRRAKEAAGT